MPFNLLRKLQDWEFPVPWVPGSAFGRPGMTEALWRAANDRSRRKAAAARSHRRNGQSKAQGAQDAKESRKTRIAGVAERSIQGFASRQGLFRDRGHAV